MDFIPTNPILQLTKKNFENERERLIEMINDFTEENIANEIHLAFGKLSKEQWSEATWKQLYHHLQQFKA
jgi:hypothetical protein